MLRHYISVNFPYLGSTASGFVSEICLIISISLPLSVIVLSCLETPPHHQEPAMYFEKRFVAYQSAHTVEYMYPFGYDHWSSHAHPSRLLSVF